MKMHSPLVAMLWENWRLSRVEAAQRLALGIVAGAAAMALFDAGATIAFWILILLHAFFYFSIAKLNGGRFMDGYKPGFPLYLLYPRPVTTFVFVGVAMAYDAISCTALFVISAAVLSLAFDQPLPLFSVTVFLLAYHFAYLAAQWSTRNRVVQWIAAFGISVPFYMLLVIRVKSSPQVEFSFIENAAMALLGVVCFGLTVAGVARQRRGDTRASVPRAAKAAGYPDWLVSLFRFRCPTSSATRAQLWFELKSSGLPVLTIGLAVAVLMPLLFAVAVSIVTVRHVAISGAVFSMPIVLFFLGGNAFGIRRKQGRMYASAFQATQPYGTAQLAALKVLVRSACVLAALLVVGVSLWISSSLLSAWGTWVDGKPEAIQGLLHIRREIGNTFGGLTGYAYAAQAIIACVTVAMVVAALAALEALRARHPCGVLIGRSLLLAWGVAIILLVIAGRSGIISRFLVDAIISATRWIAAAAIGLTTLYLLWRGLAERALPFRYACGAVAIWAAFAAAWVTLPRAAGVQPPEMSAASTGWMLSLLLLPLMASVLAPWALSRVRHM
jgi:hypothetical protein